MAEDRAVAGLTVKEKASQAKTPRTDIASMCPGWGPGPTGRTWAVPRAVDIPRRILNPGKGTRVIVTGHQEVGHSSIGLGAGASLSGVLVLHLPLGDPSGSPPQILALWRLVDI